MVSFLLIMALHYSLEADLGISPHVLCIKCALPMDRQRRWPMTGRCGHTVCCDCHQTYVLFAPTNDGLWQPCPMGGCREEHAFETEGKTTVLISDAIEKLREIEYSVGCHLLDSEVEARHRKQMAKVKEECRLELHELRETLKDKEDEVEKLQWTIDGMKEYADSLHERIFKKHEQENRSSDSSFEILKFDPTKVYNPNKLPVPKPGDETDSGSEDSSVLPTKDQIADLTKGWNGRKFRLRKVSIEGKGRQSGAWSKRKTPRKLDSKLASSSTQAASGESSWESEESSKSTSEAEFD